MKSIIHFLAVLLWATTQLTAAADLPAVATTPSHQPDWKLVWADEFDQAGAPDPQKWAYETGFVRNQEAQFYTRDRRENVRVENQHLIIEARKERFKMLPFGGVADYTSGSLESKTAWLYGRFEVRAKLATGTGLWPAIWMMPADQSAGWPACGEIDIMEHVGFEPEKIQTAVHTKAYNHARKNEKKGTVTLSRPEQNFYVYAVEWDEKQIVFYVDNKPVFTFHNDDTGTDSWPFSKPFHLKLNSAVGGSWGGMKGIDTRVLPQIFEIDYVRVYQRKLSATTVSKDQPSTGEPSTSAALQPLNAK